MRISTKQLLESISNEQVISKQPQQSNQALALTPLKSGHTKHCIQMAESYARHAIHL
jgi:hypothetical protein